MPIVATAIKVYSLLGLAGLFWIWFQKRLTLDLFLNTQFPQLPRDCLLALGATVFLIGIFHFSNKNFLWARQFEAELSKILVPLRVWEIGTVSLLSGFAEELFFRGALQPTMGLLPTSLLFGAAHLVPRHPFWPWSLQAAFAGFLLGSIYELTHQLYPVMLAHAVTNFVLIVILNRRRKV